LNRAHAISIDLIISPQPFQIFRFMVESSAMTTSDPIFIDNKSFVASLDQVCLFRITLTPSFHTDVCYQGGNVDSLVIPFITVNGVTISALNGSEMKVELIVNKAPLLGNIPMPLPKRETYSISFSISKASANNFGKAMRERNLVRTFLFTSESSLLTYLQRMERPVHKKLSQAPSELLPDIVTTEDGEKWVHN
jgi:hypothetical protein